MTAWQKIRFEELYAEPSRNGIYKSQEHHGRGTKIVNMGELFAHDVISDQDMNRIAINESEIQKSGLVNGDLLFGRRSLVESGAGKCSIVENLSEPTTFESSLIRVRLNTELAIPKFYFYWLRSHRGRGAIRAIVTGTNVKGIKGSDLKNINVEYPPLEVQDRITRILTVYDRLIENNRRRIQLLEQSARSLYKEWFVHLRFPGHEHVAIVDGVPEGWKETRLQDVALVNNQSLKSNFQGKIQYIDIASVTTGSINETIPYDFKDAPSRARRVVKHGDIIWSCVRPNRQSHAIIWNPSENLIVSTGFAVITPKSLPTSFLYQAITNPEFVGYLSNNARGAAYPAVTASDFEQAELLVPPMQLLDTFDDSIAPTISQIQTLKQASEKLRKARDLLLPRLMNGDIAV